MSALKPEFQPDASLLTGYVVCCVEHRKSALMRKAFQAAESLEPLSPIPLELLGARAGEKMPGDLPNSSA